MSSKLLDLSLEILKMIVEGYGLPKEYSSEIEELKSCSIFRLIKYKVDENGEVCEPALLPHRQKCLNHFVRKPSGRVLRC